MINSKSKDIPSIPNDQEFSEAIRNLNDLIESWNSHHRSLSLASNFDGQIVNVSLTAGEEKAIPHKLGIVPLYRIILRQEGNGVLSDIPSGWNQYQIKMKNNGAVTVTATIMIVRD